MSQMDGMRSILGGFLEMNRTCSQSLTTRAGQTRKLRPVGARSPDGYGRMPTTLRRVDALHSLSETVAYITRSLMSDQRCA